MATQVSLLSGAVASAGALSLQSNGTTEAIGISTGQVATLAQNPVLTSGTANGVAYLNGSKVLTTGSALTYDGNTFKNDTASTTAANIRIENGSFNRVGSFALTANGVQFDSFDQNSTSSQRAYMWLSGGSEQMRLTSTGLGIGTSSPAYKLDVRGTGSQTIAVRTQTSGDAKLYLENGGSNSGDITYSRSLQAMLFSGQTGTTHLTLDSSGNLLVGTTSFAYLNNNSVLLGAGGSAGQAIVQHISGTASGSTYAAFTYNAGAIGSITQNGTTGVLYNLTSDYRLKNNQQPLTGAKEFVMALQPKKWEWWDGSGEGVGFIAHEFMEVAKYSGHGEKDAVDEEGKIIAQSIQPSSSEVMANLVSLLQEQQALIENLTTRLAALEGAK